jgi:YggT family protein
MAIFIFVFSFVVSLVQLVFILRLILQMLRVSSQNEFAIMIAQATNPVVQPLRSILPRTRFIDISTLSVWLTVDIIKYLVIVYFQAHVVLSAFQLAVLIPADFIMQCLTLLFYAVLFHAILSFVAQGMVNTATITLKALSEPLLALGRKIIPNAGGFDLSPIVVLFVIKVIQMTITTYIPASYFF